jgi:two-component system, OmpR family, sensor kinase
VTLRARLVLGAAYLLAVVVVALEIPLALAIERRAESEFQSSVFGNAALLAARVSDAVARGNEDRVEEIVAGVQRRPGERILVVGGDGRVVADSSGTAPPNAPYATSERPELGAALGGRVDFRRRASETLGEELLLVTVPVVEGQRVAGAVRYSTPTGTVAESVRESWLRLAAIGLAVVAAGLALAWFLARSLARPVERLGGAAARLGAGDLDARAPEEGPTELQALSATFNRMATSLAANVRAQRDFLANASHQLRTPLTGLKLRLEALRAEPGPAAEQAAKAEAELDRLNALVGDLLELARASSSDPTGRTVDLVDAARQAVVRWEEPAARAGMQVQLGRDTSARVWADSGDLGHILDNLVENALRYCPPGTEITVEAVHGDGRAALIVSDTGPGIPPEDRRRLFERFYRGSLGKQAGPGTGLGLAIVAELARRWGGDVRLLDGSGTRIEASFPAAPTAS